MVNVKGNCPFCGKPFSIWVDAKGYREWKAGKLIQEAFPDISAQTREYLMTGICSKCWKEMEE